MSWRIGGYLVCLLVAVVFWISASQTEDAKAGYQGSVLMGQAMAVVIGLFLAICWTCMIGGEKIVQRIGHVVSLLLS